MKDARTQQEIVNERFTPIVSVLQTPNSLLSFCFLVPFFFAFHSNARYILLNRLSRDTPWHFCWVMSPGFQNQDPVLGRNSLFSIPMFRACRFRIQN